MDRRDLLVIPFAWVGCAFAAEGAPTATWVAVMRRGEFWGIDAVIQVPVTPAVAWEVLTDFDGMAGFVPNLAASRVLSRDGDVLRVEQRGEYRWGPVISAYLTVREIQLQPLEQIRATSVAGAEQRESSLTRLKAVAGGTEVWYRAEIGFRSWMPNYLAERFLRGAMQERYEAIVAEMVRRGAAR